MRLPVKGHVLIPGKAHVRLPGKLRWPLESLSRRAWNFFDHATKARADLFVTLLGSSTHVVVSLSKLQDGKDVPAGDASTTKGELLSAFEVACPYPVADQEKLPWRFHVSVSNNGVDQSTRFKTVVYDKLCHVCDKEGHCSPKVVEVRGFPNRTAECSESLKRLRSLLTEIRRDG